MKTKNLIEDYSFNINADIDEKMQNDPSFAEFMNQPINLRKGFWKIVTSAKAFDYRLGADIKLEKGEIKSMYDLINIIKVYWKAGYLTIKESYCL